MQNIILNFKDKWCMVQVTISIYIFVVRWVTPSSKNLNQRKQEFEMFAWLSLAKYLVGQKCQNILVTNWPYPWQVLLQYPQNRYLSNRSSKVNAITSTSKLYIQKMSNGEKKPHCKTVYHSICNICIAVIKP